MQAHIDIIGVGADGTAGLRPELIERVHAADFLAGGERHLGYFPKAGGERFVIKNNVVELLVRLRERLGKQRCVVLASGDPMLGGIGILVADRFGRDRVRIEPAPSSMQLAFARAGWPWETAALGSVHGRELRTNLLPLLGRDLIGLFTHDGDSPAAVARFFLRYGVPGYEAVVGENLGGPDERVTHWPDLDRLAEQRFGPLNYLILHRTDWPVDEFEVDHHRGLVPGVPDETFARSETGPEVMTRQEVRAVVLAKLLLPTAEGDTVWDVGAGLGTVSVEVAVLRPHVEVVAVERDPARAALLKTNRERFGAYNIRVVEGTAPEALAAEAERPRLVFVGGSGDRLPAILDLVAGRLDDGGRLVAAFVTLEHLLTALQGVRGWGWPVDATEVQVARGDALAGLTGLKPHRGVFLVRADKPQPSPPPPGQEGGTSHE
jgi:precorrin-6Y C5,15-methyltransferase (decarboxylating)